MDILFQASYPLHPKTPEQIIASRVKAKVALWSFLEETLPEILKAYQKDGLIEEIIKTCIWVLHPHYSGTELLEEIKLILISLKIEVPGNYTGLFVTSFASVVEKKLRN